MKFEVLLDSLPADLQARAVELWPDLAVPHETPAPAASARVGLSHSTPLSSTATEIVAAPRPALVRPRRGRSDRGARRVFISRAWDNGVPFDPDTKARIADATRKDVASLWAADARGWRNIANLALPKLMGLTKDAGFAGSDDALKAICQLPRDFIDREYKYRAVAIYDKDAKAFFDRQPRVRRDYSALRPNDMWIGDVHPVDILYTRPDGSTATPKLIALLDAKSNFVIAHPVFLDEGEGVRMEHVAQSFALAVVEFGMPARLYLDNGGEYNWADFAADAMKLVTVNDDDAKAIHRALPYNAPAKKIESIFNVLEQVALRAIPGWIGGDRMRKKTHNVGREPKPFPGTPAELWTEIQKAIDYYNARPQHGLGGRCPRDVFEADWHPVTADMADLQTAFSREEVRTLKRHAFTLDSVTYRHDELDARPWLDKVVIRVPVFGDRARLAVFEPDGAFMCHAAPDAPYHALDRAGAKESARRKKSARDGVKALKRNVQGTDMPARMAAYVALHPKAPPPEPAGVISLDGEMARAAEDLRRITAGEPAEAPEPKAERDGYDILLERMEAQR